MERKITKELLKWKIDTNKKPILLYGIPNIGKTYTCLEFGKTEYKNTIYFDCLDNLELDYVFEKTGVRPLIYCQGSYTKNLKAVLEKNYGLEVYLQYHLIQYLKEKV